MSDDGRYSRLGEEDWRSVTPPGTPTGRQLMEELHQDAKFLRERAIAFERRLEASDGAIGEMMREVARYRSEADIHHREHSTQLRAVVGSVRVLTKAVEKLTPLVEAFNALSSTVRLQGVAQTQGFERVCELLHAVEEKAAGAAQEARDSSHNLDEFGKELEKAKKHMKWPTAFVCGLLILSYTFLTYAKLLPEEVTKTVVTVIVSAGALTLAAMPEVIPNILVRVGLRKAPDASPPSPQVKP